LGDKTEKGGEGGLRPVLELVPANLKSLSAPKRRLFELPLPNADEAILYRGPLIFRAITYGSGRPYFPSATGLQRASV
jgi:hypothetical protein